MSRIVFEGQVAFANNDGANTVKTLDVPTDAEVTGVRDVVIEVRNPGAVVLTVKARTREGATGSFGGGSTRYPLLQ